MKDNKITITEKRQGLYIPGRRGIKGGRYAAHTAAVKRTDRRRLRTSPWVCKATTGATGKTW